MPHQEHRIGGFQRPGESSEESESQRQRAHGNPCYQLEDSEESHCTRSLIEQNHPSQRQCLRRHQTNHAETFRQRGHSRSRIVSWPGEDSEESQSQRNATEESAGSAQGIKDSGLPRSLAE